MARARTRAETSAGGVVYRGRGAAAQILLIRDSYKSWGFPKGHLKAGESSEDAALREVAEETGLADLVVRGPLGTIDWFFTLRGRRIHKHCHYYLMESTSGDPSPQRAEGITECVWLTVADALAKLSYANAREVLARAGETLSKAEERERGKGKREGLALPRE
jgi:8-oxo-dGTP pyrophosphatase MutT (NUDIX family)